MEQKDKQLQLTYDSLKKKHPERILLIRDNGFYYVLHQDAIDASKILRITYNEEKNMAQFPKAAIDTYLPKLIRAGKRVAITDIMPEVQNNQEGA